MVSLNNLLDALLPRQADTPSSTPFQLPAATDRSAAGSVGSSPSADGQHGPGSLLAGIGAQPSSGAQDAFIEVVPKSPGRSGAFGVDPTYNTTLPPGAYQNRTFFSENEVPLNTMVMSHSDTKDQEAGKAIAQSAVKANPNVKIAMMVSGIQGSVEDKKQELAKFYGIPAENIAPVNVEDAALSGVGTIGMWPQDGFMAGKGGLIEPATENLRHASDVAEQVGAALGIPLGKSDAIGMGGDTTFLTRPDGTQVAYFAEDTLLWSADALNKDRKAAGKPALDIAQPGDRLLTMAHVMDGMKDAGVAMENVMPVGVPAPGGPQTYGEVLNTLTPEQKKEIDPEVMKRLEQMKDMPFPGENPSKALSTTAPKSNFNYHSDLFMASPDGKTMFINSDDAKNSPQFVKQLESFGYDPVELPASFDPATGNRTCYTNMIMGKGPDGKTVVMLPTEAQDPNQLTANDRTAIAAIQAAVPDARVIPMGGETAKMTPTRDFGAHCRTNVLPHVTEEKPPAPQASAPKAEDVLANLLGGVLEDAA